MNMLEYLEQDKTALIQKLEDGKTMENAEKLICKELDSVLLRYNENCELPIAREMAAYLVQAIKLSGGLIQSVGETKVWEEVASSTVEKRGGSVKQKIFGVVGITCGIFSVVSALFAGRGESIGLADLLLAIVLMAGAVICAYLTGGAGKSGTVKASKKNNKYRTEHVVDAEHIYNCLHNILFAADQGTQQILLTDSSAKEEGLEVQRTDILSNSIDLIASLLEAEQMQDGEFALDKIKEMRFYLHKKGIEAVEYNGDNRELFDFMPSKEERTFRPALVADGKVLKRGLASGGNR